MKQYALLLLSLVGSIYSSQPIDIPNKTKLPPIVRAQSIDGTTYELALQFNVQQAMKKYAISHKDIICTLACGTKKPYGADGKVIITQKEELFSIIINKHNTRIIDLVQE